VNKQPSILKILTIDYIAFLGWIFPVVIWASYILSYFIRSVKINFLPLPVVYIAITIAALIVVLWRIQVIYSVFSDGMEAPATINRISFFRDRGKVDYVYTHQGQKYVSSNSIHRVKQTLALKIEDQVVVVIDRNHPKKAFIRDLYI